MIKSDYNRDNFGSFPEPPSPQRDGFGYVDNYQQDPSMVGQSYPPANPGFRQQNSFYGQHAPLNNRPGSIPGAPAQSTPPGPPGLSEEDVEIFKETQKNIIFKRFLPAAVLGCGAIFMAHRKKLFKPSAWTYGIYLCTTSYVTQFTARDELRRRVAESSSMSPFAQQVRLQLGYVNKQGSDSFADESSDPSYFTGVNSNSTSTSSIYSPYNRYHRQKQSTANSEFATEFESDGKDLTEFSNDPKNVPIKINSEFAPDDVLAGDMGFRTRRVVDPNDKPERSGLTYEELRMRNRAQYTPVPGTPYMQQPQPVHNNQPDMYDRPGLN